MQTTASIYHRVTASPLGVHWRGTIGLLCGHKRARCSPRLPWQFNAIATGIIAIGIAILLLL